MNTKILLPIPHDLKWKNDKVILKGQFTKKKSNKERTLICYNSYILFCKKNDVPVKYLKLEFDTKFEVARKPVQKKDEDDDTIGAITGLNFLRQMGEHFPSYDLVANEKQVREWREFLKGKINQWQFHHLFRVYKKIGKGNFASVYMAERIEDDEHMAVKAFSKSIAYAEENGKEAIQNELNIMRQVNNNHLMKMHEVYETQNSLYVALEMLNGGSLYELVKDKTTLTVKQIQTILVGLLQGLAHMHSRDIMHRDLKLENILFKQPKKLDTVVIADFGLATLVHEPVYLYCRCGTPGYVAPEVINIKDMKSRYSSVCDVYSLGLIFYLLLSSKPAFPGKSYGTVVKQNREATIDFNIKQLLAAPQAALDLMKLMLEKDPNKRITAAKCLEHPFLLETAMQMIEDEREDNDYIQEGDEQTNLSQRMNALNDESVKFDMLRKTSLMNSPQLSPNIAPTRDFKNSKNIDSQDKIHMQSPLLNGRQDNVDSIGNIGSVQSPNNKPGFQGSPMLKPSKFKVPGQMQQMNLQQQQQQQPVNSNLLKYTKKQE